MQWCLNKELYNFSEWYVCSWRNNEKQFTISNSQTDNHVMFTIFEAFFLMKKKITSKLMYRKWYIAPNNQII